MTITHKIYTYVDEHGRKVLIEQYSEKFSNVKLWRYGYVWNDMCYVKKDCLLSKPKITTLKNIWGSQTLKLEFKALNKR